MQPITLIQQKSNSNQRIQSKKRKSRNQNTSIDDDDELDLSLQIKTTRSGRKVAPKKEGEVNSSVSSTTGNSSNSESSRVSTSRSNNFNGSPNNVASGSNNTKSANVHLLPNPIPISIPEGPKSDYITKEVQDLLLDGYCCSPRKLAGLKGKLIALKDAVIPFRLYTRRTNKFHSQCLTLANGDCDQSFPIPQDVKLEISHWLTILNQWNGKEINVSSTVKCVADLTSASQRFYHCLYQCHKARRYTYDSNSSTGEKFPMKNNHAVPSHIFHSRNSIEALT
ncbi:hypothetical protein ACTFIW_010315 [Dictyostelium discoideum]